MVKRVNKNVVVSTPYHNWRMQFALEMLEAVTYPWINTLVPEMLPRTIGFSVTAPTTPPTQVKPDPNMFNSNVVLLRCLYSIYNRR